MPDMLNHAQIFNFFQSPISYTNLIFLNHDILEILQHFTRFHRVDEFVPKLT